MSIIETLTMAEVEELASLTGRDFMDIMANGVQPGRPMAALAWIIAKRANPNEKLETFMGYTMKQMSDYIKSFGDDPKEEPTSN
jgi:hypothetical protein